MSLSINAGVQKPSLTGQQGDGQNENTAPTDSGARSRASPGRPTVRRVGGGYAHSPSPSSRTSPAATAAAAAAVATAHCDGATKGSLTVAAGKETEHENTAHPRMPSAPNQASCDLALEVHLSNAMETMSIQSSDEALDDCDAALRSEPQAREAARPGAAREAHHRFVPQVLKVGGTSARQELVLGSPSTRASTPQSRTQVHCFHCSGLRFTGKKLQLQFCCTIVRYLTVDVHKHIGAPVLFTIVRFNLWALSLWASMHMLIINSSLLA